MISLLRAARGPEDGFSLIELLIVIVVLGILGGIVVFGVGSFRADSEASACAANLKTVQVAATAYLARTGGPARDVATLVDAKYIESAPTGILVKDGAVSATCQTGKDLNQPTPAPQPDPDLVMCGIADEGFAVSLTVPPGTVIKAIDFLSYGLPGGACGEFTRNPICDASTSSRGAPGIPSFASFIGQTSISVPMNNRTFGDPCHGRYKRGYLQISYG